MGLMKNGPKRRKARRIAWLTLGISSLVIVVGKYMIDHSDLRTAPRSA